MTQRLSHSRRPPPFAPTLCLLAALGGVLFTGCAGSAPPAPATLPAASVDAARKSVEYLAGADLEGRGLGTAGLDAAAQYIAGYFKGLGLNPPPGQSDYFQPFTYTTLDGIAPET